MLLRRHRTLGKPIVLSSGMSSLEQIDHAVEIWGRKTGPVALHQHLSAKLEELNLKVIPALMQRYAVPIGYSGHESVCIPRWRRPSGRLLYRAPYHP